MATLILLGRALALKPGAYGELFHKVCTVTRTTVERSWSGGRPQNTRVSEEIPMYWYDTHKVTGEKIFCTYSGYAKHVQETLKSRGIEVEVVVKTDHGLPAPDLRIAQGATWRPRQKDVMVKLLTAAGGVIVCPTGFGKTFLIKLLAKMYPTSKILFTVTSKDVASRVYRDLAGELGSEVGFIGASKYLPRRVTICIAKSLHKCPPDMNLVLVDECHEMLTVPYLKMLNKFVRAKMFGFTASPEGRTDGTDSFAHAIFGPKLIEVDYQEGVAGGNIVPITVKAYRVTTGPDVDQLRDPNLVLRYGIWRNSTRNRLIADVTTTAREERGEDAQILIMVSVVEHAYLLGQLLPDFQIVTGEVTKDRYHRMRKEGVMTEHQRLCSPEWREHCLKKFESFELKRVIATMVWKQGVDFRDLSVLVRADGLASPINAIQISGRLSRLGSATNKSQGLLIDFVDQFAKPLKSKSDKRMSTYRKNGWAVEYETGI